MALVDEIHVSDVGTQIQLTIKDKTTEAAVDVSGTTVTLILLKPSGSTLSKGMQFITDGSDGGVYYTIEASDIDEAGRWKYQIKVVSGNNVWYSDLEELYVLANITLNP